MTENKLWVCVDGMVFSGECGIFRLPTNRKRFDNPAWEKLKREKNIVQWRLSYAFLERGRRVSDVLSACGIMEDEIPMYTA